MIIRMRLPVTSSRRCEQITALGASDVPDVKISAQIASTSGSMPRSSRRHRRERVVERRAERRRRIVGVGEPGRREHRRQLVGDRREQCLVPGLGDHESAVRVLHVAQEVLAAAGVVEADDRPRRSSAGAAEREQVVGRVVEQHRDVPRPLARQPRVEQRREPARLLEVLAWVHVRSPNLIAGRSPNSRRVAAQQRGGVRRDQRRLAGRGDRTGA